MIEMHRSMKPEQHPVRLPVRVRLILVLTTTARESQSARSIGNVVRRAAGCGSEKKKNLCTGYQEAVPIEMSRGNAGQPVTQRLIEMSQNDGRE
jgi:hypothetical protein